MSLRSKHLLMAGLTISGVFASVSLHAAAQAATTATDAQSTWDGVWSDGQGGFLWLQMRQGFLESTGKDAESVFRCAYLVTGDTAEGHGTGVNQEGQQFLYWSTLRLQEDGTLLEEWRARFPDAPEREGRAVFRKQR